MEGKIGHLEMIKGAIDGASSNSLRVEGFAILLLIGTVALLLRDGVRTDVIPFLFGVVLILIVAFLFLLDFYFIRQSSLFKILYNQVRLLPEDEVDFSMEVEQYSDELNEQYKEFPPFQLVASGVIHLCIILLLFFGMLPPQLVMIS